MQKEDYSYDGLAAGDKSSAEEEAPLQFFDGNPFLSPTSPSYVNSGASFYTSLFQNCYSSSPTETASFDDGGDTDRRLQDASCVLEYQQLYNRYKLCIARLHDSVEEVEALRRENESLRMSNADLSRRIALLFSRDRLLSELNRLSVASPSASPPAAGQLGYHVAGTQPLSEHNRVERRSSERISLPKSISVRSSDYLRMSRHGRETSGHKAECQSAAASRVYIPTAAAGTKKEEEAVELDVYNQGMFKTELCNKWQETGACPYGENCQFAHGIKELRPVIRHPRYKTEVCRMVLAGDICPYGHRCHFRHSLTEEERLMAGAALPR
ncbi:zinc finger CCCH domain-containing protein 14-like isoform X2 [Andrographis paniculata]|uniref:zinc finger CCCH domain-containing protein 14-like isoform X2 n=1 Tax=Andrographis paniculata TaxID=175694 RepID=UPI0021E7A6E8|nr:zinc finger CCCH domain-containing protein 14-like isoform X2 [Andrographis paniculata]